MRNWLNCLWMWLNQVFVNDYTEILGIFSRSYGASTCIPVMASVIGASRLHSDTPHSVGFLWMSDHPRPETSAWQHTHKIQTSVPLGSETAFPASEPPQTHALDRAASGIGIALLTTRIFLKYKLWGLWRAREWIGYSVNDKWTGSHPVSQSVR